MGSTRRTGKGTGTAPRVPIRGFAKVFKEFPTPIRRKLEAVWEEAENLLDFHTRSTPARLTQRVISGLVAIPIARAESSSLGGSVSWDRVFDPRVSFYEVQLDDVNVFPNPQSFQVIEPFFALENITTEKFVRVRAVRNDGRTGNWSNTVSLVPLLAASVAFSQQFYQNYDPDDPEPTLEVIKRYGGEKTPKFYTLLEGEFYSNRASGGVTIWGYISSRLSDVRDSNITPWDRVRFSVNGITKAENYFPLWASAYDDEDTPGYNPTTGDPLSFYAKGGYTASFGPWTVPIPTVERGEGGLDPTKTGSFYIEGIGLRFPWDDTNQARRPARIDTTPLNPTVLESPIPHEEAIAYVPIGGKTHFMTGYDYRFKVPSDASVTGIELGVKRRQWNPDFDFDPLRDEITSVDQASFDPAATDDPIGNVGGIGSIDGPIDNPLYKGGMLRIGVPDYNYGSIIGPQGGVFNTKTTTPHQFAASGTDVTVSTFCELLTTLNTNLAFWIFGLGTTNNAVHLAAIRQSIGGSGIALPGLAHLRVTLYDKVASGVFPRIDVVWNNRIPIVGSGFTLANIVVSYKEIPAYVNNPLATDTQISSMVTAWVNGQSLGLPDSISPLGGSSVGWKGRDNTTSGRYQILYNKGFPPTAHGIKGTIGQTAYWGRALDNEEIEELWDKKGTLDYRVNAFDYHGAADLSHYWFKFPNPSDIKDNLVILRDEDGRFRIDLDNKALDESWPKLSRFYADGSTGGIPHDSAEGYGWQAYGGQFDLWGRGSWTPGQINSFYFGGAVSARNVDVSNDTWAFVDHMKMKVYYTVPTIPDGSVRFEVQAEAVNQFYVQREVYGGLFNGIETGSFF